MAANLFKTRYIPNNDGTDSAVAATNVNTAFVHTYLGDDATGDGTREKPFRSVNRANQKSGIAYILFRGVINEYFTSNKLTIGDDVNQMIIFGIYKLSSLVGLIRLRVDYLNFTEANSAYYSKIQRVMSKSLNSNHYNYYCLAVDDYTFTSYSKTVNSTIGGLIVNSTSEPNYDKFLRNNIFFKSLDISTSKTVFDFKNIVLLSTCRFSIENINIILPKFSNDSILNVSILKSAYIAAGTSNAVINGIFSKDVFERENFKIINEQRSGGTSPNIFTAYAPNVTGMLTASIAVNTAKTSLTLTVADASKVPDTGDLFIPFTGTYTNNGASITDGYEVFTYTSKVVNSPTSVTLNGASYTFKMPHDAGITCTRYGDVLDYTLNPDVRNEALYASDTGGYVGCFAPAVKKEFSAFTASANVNADGTDAGSVGDLMQFNDTDGLTFNNTSAQAWNRIRTAQVIEVQSGQTFKGLNVMSQDGSPFGYYVGKHQNLIGTDKILAGGNLTVGKIYKIFNDTEKDTTRGVIYNRVNYFPEYTFICVAGALSFAEINTGSGTYVREVLADVLESIEVLPYDDAATPSAFPRFSAPLTGEPKLIYYTAAGAARYGKAVGMPVLFSHLKEANFIADFGTANDKIAYYDTYAVSNADQEFYRLTNAELNATLKGYFKTDIPLLKFLHLEINGHFDEPYDY